MKEQKKKSILVNEVAKKLNTLKDPGLKFNVFKETMGKLSDEEGASLLNEIVERTHKGNITFKDILQIAIEYLQSNAISYEKLVAIYSIADIYEWESVKKLLLSAPAMKQASKEEMLQPDIELGDKTLGERKWMAKKFDRDLLDRLFYDPDPTVMKNLLQNPRITETDVIKAAARRPNSASILEEVFRSKKWISRYRIKRVLVLNPYTPTGISLKLLPLLQAPDLQSVAEDTALHPLVREEALNMLKKRRTYREKKSLHPKSRREGKKGDFHK